MRSFFENKTWVLLISILALGALTVLSVSLKNVSFNESQPIGRRETVPLDGPPVPVGGSSVEISIWSQIFLWMTLAMLVALVLALLSPEARKRLIRILIRVIAFYWALYFLLERYPEILSALELNFNGTPAGGQVGETAELPPPVFVPPQLSPLLSYAISILVVLTVVYLGWWLYHAWKELNPSGGREPLNEIARIARSSLRDLSSGRDSTDVILNCYFRMGDVVADKKNLRRGHSMTPSEFAVRLESSGLPGDAVRRLTRLFEDVRYGSHKTGPKDVNEAVMCLTTILQYCGESV